MKAKLLNVAVMMAVLSSVCYSSYAATAESGAYYGIGKEAPEDYYKTKKVIVYKDGKKPVSNNEHGEGAGPNSLDSNNYEAVAIGRGAYTSHGFSTAIGTNSHATMTSVAAGAGSYATNKSTSVGVNAYSASGTAIGYKAMTGGGLAIGKNAVSGYFYDHIPGETSAFTYGIAIGDDSLSRGGTAIGDNSKASHYGVAVGKRTNVYHNGVALGDHATVTRRGNGGVALGTDAVANRSSGVIGFVPTSDVQPTNERELGKALGLDVVDAFYEKWETTNTEYGKVLDDFYKATNDSADNEEIIRQTKGSTDPEDIKKYEAANKVKKELHNKAVEESSKRNQWEKEHKEFLTALEEKDTALSSYLSTQGAVSVGNNGDTRQIIHVAAGTAGTDAVNVDQLKRAMEKVSENRTSITVSGSAPVSGRGKQLGAYVGENNLIIAKKTVDGHDTYDLKLNDKLSLGGDGEDGKIELHSADDAKVVYVTGDGIHAQAGTDKTALTEKGLTIEDGPSVTKEGLDAGNKKITNVADGGVYDGSTDAINGNQLYHSLAIFENQGNGNLSRVSEKVNRLDARVSRIGAQSAALAALHPLDFDPTAKWDIAAGYGNYKGKNASALGLFYRANEDTMISVATTFGEENMVNAGISIKLGQGDEYVGKSKIALSKEVMNISKEVRQLKADNEKLMAIIQALLATNPTITLTVFPDAPNTHWAYESMKKLRDKGALNQAAAPWLDSDRPVTRYEFASVIYQLLKDGVEVDAPLIREFSPELTYLKVRDLERGMHNGPILEGLPLKIEE